MSCMSDQWKTSCLFRKPEFCCAISLSDSSATEITHYIILSVWISSLVGGLSTRASFSYAKSSITGQPSSPTLWQKPMSSNRDQTPLLEHEALHTVLLLSVQLSATEALPGQLRAHLSSSPMPHKKTFLNRPTWIKVLAKKWKGIQKKSHPKWKNVVFVIT